MEKILGSCSLLSLYHYYSILLLLIIIIIIPLILVLITTTPPDPLPLFSTLNPNNNYSQKSLLFSLSFSLFIFVSALPTDSFCTLCDFFFPYLFSLFLSILYLGAGETWFSDCLPVSSKFLLGIFFTLTNWRVVLRVFF